MTAKQLAAAALFTAGAIGLAGTAAHAQPTAQAPTVESVQLTPSGDGVLATVAGGRFAAADNGRTVTVADGTGRIVERLPMAYRADGRTFPLRASVEHNGSQLRLTPVGTPAAPADRAQLQKQFVDYNADLARHQYNAGVGALIGAAIGGLIGFIFLGIGAIPGILIGALIGAGIGWISP